MLPGSGIRAWWTYTREMANPDYNRTLFVRQLLAELPAEATYIVDPAYVFDFYLAGRQVTLGINHPFYFVAEGQRYDYYVASRYGLRNGIPPILHGRLLVSRGRPDDSLAQYAAVYVPDNSLD